MTKSNAWMMKHMGDDQVKYTDDETWVMTKSNAWMMKHMGDDQVKYMDDDSQLSDPGNQAISWNGLQVLFLYSIFSMISQDAFWHKSSSTLGSLAPHHS